MSNSENLENLMQASQQAMATAKQQKQRADQLQQKNEEQSAQIQKLLSDKQKLSEALKQRNNDVQTMNAQIVKLKGADKVLEENQKLKQLNDQLSRGIQSAKAEADEAKQKAQDSARSSQEAHRRILAKERRIDHFIEKRASERTREAKNELESNYRTMTTKTKAILAAPTLYSLVLSLVLFFRLPHVWRDLQNVFRDILWFVWKPTSGLFHASTSWWWGAHWLLPALVLVLLVALVLLVVVAIAARISEIADSLTIFPDGVVLLVMVAVVLVFGPTAQGIFPWLNLAWVLIISTITFLIVRPG